ncbi:MAG: hypothetical protein VX642_04665 [Bdellovibrionota bacterium]|nr:hypothetical protein [Bdellovibrionota bacterium]
MMRIGLGLLILFLGACAGDDAFRGEFDLDSPTGMETIKVESNKSSEDDEGKIQSVLGLDDFISFVDLKYSSLNSQKDANARDSICYGFSLAETYIVRDEDVFYSYFELDGQGNYDSSFTVPINIKVDYEEKYSWVQKKLKDLSESLTKKKNTDSGLGVRQIEEIVEMKDFKIDANGSALAFEWNIRPEKRGLSQVFLSLNLVDVDGAKVQLEISKILVNGDMLPALLNVKSEGDWFSETVSVYDENLSINSRRYSFIPLGSWAEIRNLLINGYVDLTEVKTGETLRLQVDSFREFEQGSNSAFKFGKLYTSFWNPYPFCRRNAD